ncbi:hypothetical protein SAMN04487905_10644 [Actinopolyspora xinjiangensis]|uniref:Uncharacterized protein n=1 Tax=Actinopolyspora xinjiangensis TaxID=405564 RepID=A0A1H0U4U8_9ACTN|nr:hypothetical protein [Actinopolyspora xinjiangensis]SDP61090.1 hypothetical protein SAMN04487905_10644 [Actinopolyspora xinjiangensis]
MTEPTWRDWAGRSITDPTDPNGRPIETPTDRRWLWRIETDLAVSATTDSQRRLAHLLREYLDETCEHHYLDYDADEAWDAHRQCLWCNHIEEGEQ